MPPLTRRDAALRDPTSSPSENDALFHTERSTGEDPPVRSVARTRRAALPRVAVGSPPLSVLERDLDSTVKRQPCFVLTSPPMPTEDEPFGSLEWKDRQGRPVARAEAQTFHPPVARYSADAQPTAPFDPAENPGVPPPTGDQ